MRQIRVCRTAAEPLKVNIERYLAKECVGSDRARLDRSQDPEATTSRVKKQVTREQNQTPKQKQKPVELRNRSSTEQIPSATTLPETLVA